MLQIDNLTVTLKRDLRTIFDGFSLTVNDGDKAAIIGEEGDGKSTLLKIIADPAAALDYCEISGGISINGGEGIGYLRQELDEAAKALSIYEYCRGAKGFLEASPGEITEAARKLGLEPGFFYSAQSVGSLSGGERVKLQLFSVIIAKPAIWLLDEPSNDIDIDALIWLERAINEAGAPVLFVSHDETLIENAANMIVHIEQVRKKSVCRATVTRGGYRGYIERRESSLARQERQAKNEKAEYGAKMERFRKIRDKVERDQDEITRQNPHGGALLKKKMRGVQAMGRRFEREREDMTQLPDVEAPIFMLFESEPIPNGKTVLEFSLKKLVTKDDRTLSERIELNIYGAKKICITGKNGAGKTTLLKLIAEELLSRRDIKAAYMPQNYDELLDPDGAAINFLAPSGLKADITRARTYLGSLKFTAGEMERPVSGLSGGQRAKLLLLSMILKGANVLLLDEPTRNFSPLSNPVLRGVIKSFNGAVICVSHDRKFIGEVCDSVYELTPGGLFLK